MSSPSKIAQKREAFFDCTSRLPAAKVILYRDQLQVPLVLYDVNCDAAQTKKKPQVKSVANCKVYSYVEEMLRRVSLNGTQTKVVELKTAQ